ncbi:MAG: S41 family peptidase [Lachnospiraceae bacterium]|nr:S41 family peptidase [Lachnospiraceae bacterium]
MENLAEEKPKKKRNKSSFRKGLITGIGVTMSFVIIVLLIVGTYLKSTYGSVFNGEIIGKLAVINAVLDKYYYQDIDDDAKIESLYKGLVESAGDDYTVYYTADEYQDFLVSTTGTYAGIGAVLSQDKSTMEISIKQVYDDSPAANAGLQMGDVIVSVDGYKATDYELDQFVDYIRGDEGTSLEMVFQRDGEEHTVTVERDSIVVPSVSYQMLDGNIGYVQINDFSNNTKNEYDAAMKDLTNQGMKAVIYDLRANGGGLVDSVTAILDEILPGGTTVYMLDKDGNRTDYTSDGATKIDIPITVLTSEYTASSAEIFTGAIQDFNYGTIIGTQTFGKGIVQTTIPFSDGSAVKVTTSRYYTPNGTCIHGVGITPDIELSYEFMGSDDDEYSVDKDNQIQKAIEVLQEKLGE